jgi:hypothetical protein
MENNIAFRPLAIKPEDSDSWFIQIVKVTEMYNLPSPRDILNPVPNKAIWKRTIYTAINEILERSISERCYNKIYTKTVQL